MDMATHLPYGDQQFYMSTCSLLNNFQPVSVFVLDPTNCRASCHVTLHTANQPLLHSFAHKDAVPGRHLAHPNFDKTQE
jgi:hypothetical protein